MREQGFSGEPIEVFRVGKNLYIINGHHRAAAAMRVRGLKVHIRELSEAEIKTYGYQGAADVLNAADAAGPNRLR